MFGCLSGPPALARGWELYHELSALHAGEKRDGVTGGVITPVEKSELTSPVEKSGGFTTPDKKSTLTTPGVKSELTTPVPLPPPRWQCVEGGMTWVREFLCTALLQYTA